MTLEREPHEASPEEEEDTLPQDYAEITVTEPEVTSELGDDEKTPIPARDVRILDFKDGHGSLSVTHGPIDPSRVWIAFQNREAYLHLSFEEGLVRRLAEGLRLVLETFHEVRSAIHQRGGTR